MRFVCADGEPQYYPFIDAELSTLSEAGHTLDWCEGTPSTVEDWVARLQEADGLLLLWRLPREVLKRSPSVRIVAFAGTGVAEYVDLEEAARCSVTVCNVPDYAANAVAEHALALMLSAARHIPRLDGAVRNGEWQQELDGVELAGRRLGVIGVGSVGARVVELGRAIGMRVMAWTRNPDPVRASRLGVDFVPLQRLFSKSEVISINLAYGPDTHGMISADLISQLPPGAILVNTARGALVEEGALHRGLRSGALGGIGLDVYSSEPPSRDDALLMDRRVVWTPHVGYGTTEATQRLVHTAIGNLCAFASGDARNVVRNGNFDERRD